MSSDLKPLLEQVPEDVLGICRRLREKGKRGWIVGGCVRDLLRGGQPKDWDVATDARPDDVITFFHKVIPTGIQHGTVTVVTGSVKTKHVEVTTYRGEGAYTDARRPDHVVFGVPLIEDLARRDLVVNAMAYDPSTDVLHDPFGGLDDIARKRLRAVGPTPDAFVNAVGRFSEDGLRVMRAVRFAAVLGFALDPDTERGIAEPRVLASLRKVSRERVSDELRKLLAAPAPSVGLAIAHRTGIVHEILPDLALASPDAWLARIDAAPDRARLGALVADLAVPDARLHRATVERADKILKALKFSNDESGIASKLAGVAATTATTDAELRRVLADVGRAVAPIAVELWQASGLAIADRAKAVLADPLAPAELAVGGKDLIDALSMSPGPAVGKLLAALFERVLLDPSLNTRQALLAVAKELT